MKAVLVLDEMPKDCYDCPLSKEDTIYGEHVFICTGYNAEIEDIGTKEDWCPLIPLPKGHGAIKDVSKIEIPMCEDRAYEKWVQVAINSAPTIIEADKGETE